jgi:hypothetical protein
MARPISSLWDKFAIAKSVKVLWLVLFRRACHKNLPSVTREETKSTT